VVCIEPGFFATSVVRKARPLPAASTYTEMERLIAGWYHANVQMGGDPAHVAEAIAAAVDDPSTPVHVPVGPDAEAAIQAASSMTGEQWADVSRKVYGLES
jgi:NAD(P)-dependent dehydrogenase (short-subunit alcohol dehydrogenase family)